MDEKKKKMADVGALLLSVGAPEEKGEREEGGEDYEKDADPEDLAEEAMSAFIDAVHARDAKGALAAFKSLDRLCPMMPEDEESAEDEGKGGDNNKPEMGEEK